MKTMQAAWISKFGGPEVLEIRTINKPTIHDGQVLVRVRASTVSAADWRIRKADPFVVRFLAGLLRPTKIRIGGMELAGTVESVGKLVTRFAAGDEVFGGTLFKLGTHAEYVCVPETQLAMKPGCGESASFTCVTSPSVCASGKLARKAL